MEILEIILIWLIPSALITIVCSIGELKKRKLNKEK